MPTSSKQKVITLQGNLQVHKHYNINDLMNSSSPAQCYIYTFLNRLKGQSVII